MKDKYALLVTKLYFSERLSCVSETIEYDREINLR